MDDKYLIDLFLARDESAIEQTRIKYGAKCMSIAYGILKNDQDAEEAVSDAYFAMWNKIPPEKPDIFSAYLFRIVRNQALMKFDVNSAEKRRATAVQIEELEECLPSDFDIEQSLNERWLSDLINRFLKSLPEQDRRIFICRYFAGMEYKAISKKLGIGLSRAKMSAMRSRAKLKELLIKEGFYTSILTSGVSNVKNKINVQLHANRPVIAAMYENDLNGCYMNHAVVVYGYYFETSDGSIVEGYYRVHNGLYFPNNLSVYSYDWFQTAITLE